MFDQEDQTEELELDETEAEEETAEAEDSEPEQDATEAEGDDVEEEDSDEKEGQDPESPEDEGEAFSVSFEGEDSDEEEVPKSAAKWVKHTRDKNRDLSKRNKELEAKLAELEGAKEKATLGEKPTLATCDYDEDKFETELAAWHEQKREVEKQKQAEAEAQKAEQEAWQKRLDGYQEGKAKLSKQARDFDEAEDDFAQVFSPAQQGAILHVADDGPLLVYALGKNLKKAQELAEIKDQALFIKAVTRLETTMKASTVKTAPKPEKRIGGGGNMPKSAANALEKARAKAAETGDFTEVRRLKQKMRKAK